jgi:hypothetical protein
VSMIGVTDKLEKFFNHTWYQRFKRVSIRLEEQ